MLHPILSPDLSRNLTGSIGAPPTAQFSREQPVLASGRPTSSPSRDISVEAAKQPFFVRAGQLRRRTQSGAIWCRTRRRSLFGGPQALRLALPRIGFAPRYTKHAPRLRGLRVIGLQQGIEIRYSSDGPYLAFHGGGSRVTYRLRDVARIMSQVAEPGLQRRILSAWLKESGGRTEVTLGGANLPLLWCADEANSSPAGQSRAKPIEYPSRAPVWLYVGIPLGSSSEAPVIRPAPRIRSKPLRRRGSECWVAIVYDQDRRLTANHLACLFRRGRSRFRAILLISRIASPFSFVEGANMRRAFGMPVSRRCRSMVV